MEVQLPNNWVPRLDQFALWEYLQGGGKRAVEVAHRRWGKDDVALHFTATQTVKRIGNYWHMLPEYGQAKKAIWKAINPRTGKLRIDEAFPKAIREKTNQQEMTITLKGGSIWQLVGSDAYDSIVGAPPIGIVFSEWALANPLAWAYLAPILQENGGWALFIYTSRGANHGKTTYEHAVKTNGWYSEKLTAEQTPVFTKEQLTEIYNEYTKIFGHELGLSMFNQEYLCSWTGAVLGAYFAEQIREARAEGRICKVPHRPNLEVNTYWDLGVDDSMTIWFVQELGQSYNVIDYYENRLFGLQHYAKVLKGEKEGSEHRAKYVYGNHYMPHDAANREMTNSETAKSRMEVAEDLGIRPIIITQRAKNIDIIIQVHIPAVRNMFPLCYFDEEKTLDGLNALENFRSDYDDKKKKLGNRPVHDWSSHGASAFIVFAVSGNRKYTPYQIPTGNRSSGMVTDSSWMVQ